MIVALTVALSCLTAPPPAPAAGSAVERAKLLVEAIRKDQPEVAVPFFYPRGEFPKVKAIKEPDGYFRHLMKVYLGDVRDMRKLLKQPEKVEFVSFELARARRWVVRGEEANRQPYWAAYKSQITVKDGDRTVKLPVRVMISWNGEWYVTHLTRK